MRGTLKKVFYVQTERNIRSKVLLQTISLFADRYAKAVSTDTLTANLPLPPDQESPDLLSFSQADTLFYRAARNAGFKSTLVKRDIVTVLDLHLPIILLLLNGQSCILEAFSEDHTQVKVIYPGEYPLEEWVSLEALNEEYLGYAFLLKKELPREERGAFVHRQHKKHWFWDTLKLSWPIYRDVLLASLLVNLFVLASPLFTMNVYDRVIPNNATETLMAPSSAPWHEIS